MKKITKSLAIAGALMCSSVGLVACGGETGLVDIKGNYVQTTASETTAYVNTLDTVQTEENGSYKIQMRFDVNVEGISGKLTVDGHVDAKGNFDMAMAVNARGSKASSNIYYESQDSMLYTSASILGYTEKTKTLITTDGDQYDELIVGEDFLSPVEIKTMIDKISADANISISETDKDVKIQYNSTEESEGTIQQTTVYLVLGKDGEAYNFVGARCSIKMSKDDNVLMNGYIDLVLSNEAVKTLTDAQKEEYKLSSIL